MDDLEGVLRSDEQAIFRLRKLYQKYGYQQFKMSKFEEYDLYAHNKDFLVSNHIITFTDTSGKLMALKPDVTLSIIKNSKDQPDCVQKVYYNENVYRISKGTQTYKEIPQAGLECLGDVDQFHVGEVVALAAMSLAAISKQYVLDLSHMGFVTAMLGNAAVPEEETQNLLKCIGEKNRHGIQEICSRCGVDSENCAQLQKLVSSYGPLGEMLETLSQFQLNDAMAQALQELKAVYRFLQNLEIDQQVNLDISVVSDSNYYNGIVFRGFVEGLAAGVLTGGQYDKLMKRMGRESRGIGFAVYLDQLERLRRTERNYDVDCLLLYDDTTNLDSLQQAIRLLTGNGKSVQAQRAIPEKLKYRQLLQLKDRGLEILETND